MHAKDAPLSDRDGLRCRHRQGGVIGNLARPTGNITRFPATEFSLGGKWFDLLKGLVPSTTHLAIIENPETVNSAYVSAVERVAQGRILAGTGWGKIDAAK
jgi:hypothetical protein